MPTAPRSSGHRPGVHYPDTFRGYIIRTSSGAGAEHVIDFQAEQFDTATGVYDIVIDTVGETTLERSYPMVRRGGRLIGLQAPTAGQAAFLSAKHTPPLARRNSGNCAPRS